MEGDRKINLAKTFHPMASEYSVTLLNEYSEEMVIERYWDEGFRLKICAMITEWITDSKGDLVYIKDHKHTVWSLDNRKQLRDLITTLQGLITQIEK
jgi:hypothetical protein